MTQPATTTATRSPLERPRLGYPWYVVIVLTAIYMLSFVDRQILSLLVPQIEHDLNIKDTEIGLLGGPAFALFYTFMGLPLGRMVDSLNRSRLVGICIVVWSFFTSLCSAARTFGTLFLARVGVGVGEAGLGPSAYSLIADYFPRERMGAAISVYYMGLFFGTSLAQLVSGVTVQALSRTPLLTLPLLGTIASWRATFLIVGLPGVLFALLALSIREPHERNARQHGMRAPGELLQHLPGFFCRTRFAEDTAIDQHHGICGKNDGRSNGARGSQFGLGICKTQNQSIRFFSGKRRLVHG